MPETRELCGAKYWPEGAPGVVCGLSVEHDGPHAHGSFEWSEPFSPVFADPLPAHDAPQVERFDLTVDLNGGVAGTSARGRMFASPQHGEWVRYTDYASLLAELEALKKGTTP